MDRRTGSALAGSVLILGLVAGCTAGSNSAGAPMARSAGIAGTIDAGSPAAGGGAAPIAPNQAQGKAQQGAQQVPPAAAERKVVRTAAIELRSEDVTATVHRARVLGPQVGGYVSQEDSRAEGGSLTLRVPTDKLDGVLDALGNLVGQGDVVSRTERADDVTEQVVDIESRLASQRASVARVRALLDRASSVSDVVQIEGELTKREADLESLQQRHDALSAQVAMSTVTVKVTRRDTSARPAAVDRGGFVGGLASGWRAMLASLEVLLMVLGAILPFAVPIGVLGWGALILRRRWKARRAS